MSFDPPEGILDIGNATLRVGKLEVAETSGLNQGLQNIIKNDLLITENTTYAVNHKWGLKLPTTWVGEFEVKGHSGKYIDFNFYNENSASNAQGYNLTFKDTTMTLRYDGGNPLGGGAATIPTIVGAYRKVNIFFERGVISVSIDGTRYLYHKETDGFNQGLGVASRVVSTTGSAFVNLFIEQNAADSAFKNLRIVNGRFISDETSNIAFIGGNLGVGVNSPQEALDIRGNMHFNRVSNVSQVSVDSNVVTEYTGPHDRPLRKYPEVALTADDNSSTSGYKASVSSLLTGNGAFNTFDVTGATSYWHSQYPYYTHVTGTYNPGQTALGTGTPSGTLPTTQLIPTSRGGDSHQGEWIKLQMPKKIKLEEVRVYASSRAASSIYQMPKDIAIAGSNDGTNWYLVDSGTLRTGIRESYGMASLPVTTSSYYSHLALIVKTIDNQGANYSAIEIANIEYYGREEGSGSLDTTLKSVYNVPATTGTQLEVYYDAKDLADGAVTSVTDLSPNSNGGLPSDSPQVSNGAFVFDGVNDYIYNSQSGYTASDAYTASVWVKFLPDAGSSIDPCIFQFGNGSNHSSFGMISDSSENKLRAFIFGNNAVDLIERVDNVWYHLCATYYASNGRTDFFINGILKESVTSGTAMTIPSTPYLSIGVQTDSSNTPISTTYFTGSIANFRLYSKALNADQVKELYDYQKDYFLGSKSQVSLYKGHLGVGVTEPSGQLELAGDERIQEYPPRALTGYETLVEGHGVFCASASSDLGLSYTNPYDAFSKATSVWITADNSYSSGLATNVNTFQGVNGAWLKLKLPYKINLKRFKIQGRNGSNERFIDAILYASTDDNNWDQLRSIEMPASYDYATGVDFDAPNTSKYYNYFLIQITKVQTGTGQANYANIGEWKLFGTPGPTTLDKGSLTLGRSLDVPRVSRYDVDTETPRPEKLVVDFDTTHKLAPHYENAGNIHDEAGVLDSSGQRNHGSFFGGTHYSWADKAFVFDGSQDFILTSGVPTATGSGNFTHAVSMWFKLNTIPGSGASRVLWGMVGENDGTDGSPSSYSAPHSVVNASGNISWAMWGNDLYNQTAVVANRWYHCVWTYSGGTTGRKMFLDGVEQTFQQAQTAALNMVNATSRLTIGIYPHDLATSSLDGYVSNFKLYDVGLEPSEVQKLYRLGRNGRSMVISDTAVGIGKVPEAQLDVRGDISCSAMYTGLVASLYNNNVSFGVGYTNMTWRADGNAGFNYGNIITPGEAEIRLPHKGVYRIYMKMNSQETSSTNGTVTIHLEFLNEAQNGWSLYQRSERYESAWSGGHELNFSFHCDTTRGFRWRFRFQNTCNNTWDTLDYTNATWNRTLIFKIA